MLKNIQEYFISTYTVIKSEHQHSGIHFCFLSSDSWFSENHLYPSSSSRSSITATRIQSCHIRCFTTLSISLFVYLSLTRNRTRLRAFMYVSRKGNICTKNFSLKNVFFVKITNNFSWGTKNNIISQLFCDKLVHSMDYLTLVKW